MASPLPYYAIDPSSDPGSVLHEAEDRSSLEDYLQRCVPPSVLAETWMKREEAIRLGIPLPAGLAATSDIRLGYRWKFNTDAACAYVRGRENSQRTSAMAPGKTDPGGGGRSIEPRGSMLSGGWTNRAGSEAAKEAGRKGGAARARQCGRKRKSA